MSRVAKLLEREICGRSSIERRGLGKKWEDIGRKLILVSRNEVIWVQAKENVLACVDSDRRLFIYNILDGHAEVFRSQTGISVGKVWFGEGFLHFLSETSSFQYCSFALDQGLTSTVISPDFLVDINDIEVTPTQIIAKFPEFFLIHNLLNKTTEKLNCTSTSRYTKGHILTFDTQGTISIHQISSSNLQVFQSNLSENIIQIDLVKNKLLLIFLENFTRIFNLDGEEFSDLRPIQNYFEIEDSGESVLAFEGCKVALVCSTMMMFEVDGEIQDVCDNESYIFLLDEFGGFYIMSKSGCELTCMKGSGRIETFGCSKSEDAIYIRDGGNLYVCE